MNTIPFFSRLLIFVLLFVLLAGCTRTEPQNDLLNRAGNQEVANYMKTFEARGALSDNSIPTLPEEALISFRLPDDLAMDLVLAEPIINQPLEITFDHRGRLWVVQYTQYPYPKGLKITGIDNHLRVEFDKVPAPPPVGAIGADKITFFEDTNGDGTFDKATDAITGLNIATSVALGRRNIWVLNPPYLLAYPDVKGDGLPDGEPTVHLEGFGLQDTHAVANSLRWGPDGWLYGATGSTVTSNISSSVTKNVQFSGQGIWRYHPETKIFELFAEGGGNTFHVEIDAKGRIYSGDNGVSRGQYYKQGAYYIKNWGKHGALTNPYAFGYLNNMGLQGDKLRFTHAWIKYEGDALPAHYQGKMISINPLLNYIQLTELVSNGSTFSNVDLQRIVETDDHWFRPVDIKAGPDGAVYLADWYDSRLSHVDPRDTWHKTSGRIYRLRSKTSTPMASFDLSSYSKEQLIKLLSHPNKWFRQQALRQFGDRKDKSIVPQLKEMLLGETGQLALECLWAINLSGGFSDDIAKIGLSHDDPFVRMWSVRLLGDYNDLSSDTFNSLVTLALNETHPEVQSQLAGTAKRLSGAQGIPIINGLLNSAGIQEDPDNPLLVWWALESKIDNDSDLVIKLFEDHKLWELPIIRQTILERLAQRLIMAGSNNDFLSCARLLDLAPDKDSIKPLLDGIQEGLRGKDMAALPKYLVAAIKPHLENYGNAPLVFLIRQRDTDAISSALSIITQEKANVNERLAYIRVMGELKLTKSISKLLQLVENQSSRISVRQAALAALSNFKENEIGKRVAKAYPNQLRADPALKLASLNLFTSRVSWALELLELIEGSKQVSTDDLPEQIVRQLQLLDDPKVNRSVNQLWPEIATASSADKTAHMRKITTALESGEGNISSGKQLYQQLCGTCHQLFGEGGILGPDLTGYDRNNISYLVINIVDPNIDIREGYVNYKIVKKDGRILAGTITDRSSELVTLKSFSGEEIVIPTEQIEVMEAQAISLMPERLTDNLTDQQIRDLFSYIMKTTGDPDGS